MVTGRADHANICAQPDDLPFITAAGVRLAQTHDIVQVKLEGHSRDHYSIGFLIYLYTPTHENVRRSELCRTF